MERSRNQRRISRTQRFWQRMPRVAPAPIQDVGTMAIHTGLSVTVAGHLIELERDENSKTAKLVVRVIEGHTVTGMEASAVNVAADLLYRRAQRFLGQQWKIEPLPKMGEMRATGS